MKLSEVKSVLANLERVDFQYEDGTFVPEHFHVTEIGQVNKKYIDCGGLIRQEVKISFQLWNADDTAHRLKAKKLLNIIRLSETKLAMVDAEIEVEVQGKQTIGKFSLAFNGSNFILKNTLTTCLAEDACGIPPNKQELPTNNCDPSSGCC